MNRGDDDKEKAQCPGCRVLISLSNYIDDRVIWT